MVHLLLFFLTANNIFIPLHPSRVKRGISSCMESLRGGWRIGMTCLMYFEKIYDHMDRILLRFIIVVTIISIAAGVSLRIAHPQSDPYSDQFIDTQDEGLHSYAARNYYLYHRWNIDSLSYSSIMPVYPRLQVLGLYIFGLHNYSFRAISILSALATLIMLSLFLYYEWGTVPACVGATSFATNLFLIGISRSALPETTMLFFLLMTFIACYKTMTARRHMFIWGFFTGLACMLSFFTKQSGAAIIGVIILAWLYDAIVRKKKQQYLHVFAGFIATVLIIMICYTTLVVWPNKHIWYANYKATVGGNRPRKMLIIPSYTLQQIENTITSPVWGYIPGLVAATLLSGYLILYRKKDNTTDPVLIWLSLLWIVLFLFHMYSMPDKYARFLVSGMLPMTVLLASLFRQNLINSMTSQGKQLFLMTVSAFLIVDASRGIYTGYRSIIQKPTYTYLQAAESLYKMVRKNKGIYPLHWIMNEPFNAMSTYVAPVGDTSFQQFFNNYGTPTYVALVDPQIEDFKVRAPLFYQRLTYIRTIANYHIFKYRQN